MFYVINDDFGGFTVPQEVCDILDCKMYDYSDDIRTNPVLIEWVREHIDDTDLAVVEIPDEATDWELNEYDGAESIIAVIDGKICHLCTEDEDW